MKNDLENLYQYDPERKQYRKKRGARDPKTTPVDKSSGDIYSIGTRHQAPDYRRGREAYYEKPGFGKRIVWLLLLAGVIAWISFLVHQQRKGPPGHTKRSVLPHFIEDWLGK